MASTNLNEAIGTLTEWQEIHRNSHPEIRNALAVALQACSIFAVLERLPSESRIDLDRARSGEWRVEYAAPGVVHTNGHEHWGSDCVDALGQLTTALALEGI